MFELKDDLVAGAQACPSQSAQEAIGTRQKLGVRKELFRAVDDRAQAVIGVFPRRALQGLSQQAWELIRSFYFATVTDRQAPFGRSICRRVFPLLCWLLDCR